MKFVGTYPVEWKRIKHHVRWLAGYKCERCGHEHDPKNGYALTVHHLDNNKSNCAYWNLAALCQRCHLHIQGKVNMFQFYMFTHSDWFKNHVEGFYRSIDTHD